MEYDAEKVMVTNERQSAMITRQRQQLEQQDATIRALKAENESLRNTGGRSTVPPLEPRQRRCGSDRREGHLSALVERGQSEFPQHRREAQELAGGELR